MRLTAVAAAALLAASQPALAADLKANSTIDAVTVFPEGAEITRVAKVSLTPGDQTIVLRDLPAGLIGDSVRIQGEAAGKVEIGSVDTRVFYLSEDNATVSEDARKKMQDQLQVLVDKLSGLQTAVDVANTQKQLVTMLVNLPQRPPAPGPGAATDPDWGSLVTLIGERLTQANKAIADAQAGQRDTAKKIEDLQRQLNEQPQAQEQRTEVKIHVASTAAQETTLRVRYQIPAAAWYPIYDARLDSGDGSAAPKLSLIRRAIVSQQTGESWDDVQLALSTTRPQAGTTAADLVPLSVDFSGQELAYDAVASSPAKLAKALDEKARKDSEEAGGMVAGQAAPAPVAQMADKPKSIAANVEQRRATTITTAFQAVYVITDRQSIKSGVGDKRVQIDIKELVPSLAVRAVPKFSETAYLYAKFKLDAETLLLPGTTSLFRDGVFVGRGDVPQLTGGEEHELGFGADDKVRIKFANLGRKAGETGIISTSKTDTQSFKMTVKNLYARPISVRILDQLPVSVNEQIKVDMLAGTSSPTARDVDDKKGLIAWDLKLEAAQSADLAFGYQVSWPNGKGVVYEQHPGVFAAAQK